jgi:hypothetical protein
MKKNLLPVILILIVLLVACRKPLKEVNDYFPKVKTLSAVVELDGSVTITGQIESVGETKDAALEYAGFCFSTGSDPKMQENQLIAQVNGSSFSVNYPGTLFNVDSTYFFRSWAVNNYGYAYGEIISVDSIIATPVTPPCSLPSNSVNLGGGTGTHFYYNVDAPDSYNFFAGSTSTGPFVHFQFGSALTTGIYHTTTSSSPNPGEVNVNFYSGSISGALNTGSDVYVNRISPGVHEITICSAPWIYSSSTFYFNTHFVTPY